MTPGEPECPLVDGDAGCLLAAAAQVAWQLTGAAAALGQLGTASQTENHKARARDEQESLRRPLRQQLQALHDLSQHWPVEPSTDQD